MAFLEVLFDVAPPVVEASESETALSEKSESPMIFVQSWYRAVVVVLERVKCPKNAMN
jgi:hypothetical protein